MEIKNTNAKQNNTRAVSSTVRRETAPAQKQIKQAPPTRVRLTAHSMQGRLFVRINGWGQFLPNSEKLAKEVGRVEVEVVYTGLIEPRAFEGKIISWTTI